MSGQIGFSLSNDDDARDDTFSEGSGGSITRSIGISRTGDLSVAASVNWTVSGLVLGGRALDGRELTPNGGVTSANAADFAGGTLPGGIITFAPGEEFQTISLEILGDSTPEWDEGYSVTLSSPTEGYALADYIHNAAIEDDDRPYVWIPQQYTVTHPEGDFGSTTYTFPVYRSGGMSEVRNLMADYLEFAEMMAWDALQRDESCGGHFREEHQEDGEAKRNDEDYCYVAAWEFNGVGKTPTLHKEQLVFENVQLTQRSYK
jgi:hypothetical protein